MLIRALLVNCICVGCSVEKSIKGIMAFADSGWVLKRQNCGTCSLNILFLSETLTGVDGWFLPEADTDTWYRAQMVK